MSPDHWRRPFGNSSISMNNRSADQKLGQIGEAIIITKEIGTRRVLHDQISSIDLVKDRDFDQKSRIRLRIER